MAQSQPLGLFVSEIPTVPLEVIDIRSELEARPQRTASVAEEHRAFTALAAEMATNPRNMLQKLAELAVDLCRAHTAGISLLEGDVLRWEAVAGVFASARGGTMPRDQSPCGVCIDRDATQLMHLADRCFPALAAEPRFVEELLIPFHVHGKPIGTVWVVSHTTDRHFDKEDERIIRELANFASAGWQLLQTSEALQSSNRRKDDFLATLGHELRTPLNTIVAATAVLRHRLAADEAGTRHLDVITRQSHHIERLADDLLDIARIVSGKLNLERRTLDLRGVVAGALETLERQVERRGQTLEAALGETPVFVEADPDRLAQVVINLLDNATKYTPTNGRISVAVSSESGQAVVAVRDSGVGIPPDAIHTIFELFAQLPQHRHSAAGGLGLGLSLVKSLTELHGGVVTASSEGSNRGSCFTVRIPMSVAQGN